MIESILNYYETQKENNMNTRHDIQEIIKKVCGIECSINELSNIEITKEQENQIVQIICMTGYAKDIYCFAKQRKNLSKENKNKLIEAICATKKIDVMCDFLSDVEGLTSQETDILIKKIITETESLEKQIETKGTVKEFK